VRSTIGFIAGANLPAMDKAPPARDGPLYEAASIMRSLDDLARGEAVPPRSGGVIFPVVWMAVSTMSLIAFMAWLLVS
jgi:hypothetical protein